MRAIATTVAREMVATGAAAADIARAVTAANAAKMVKSQYEAVTNLPLVAAFVAFAVAQSLKVLTTW